MPTQRTLEIADEIADAVFDVWNSYDAPDDRPLAQLMREGFEDWEDGVEVALFVEALESAGGDDALLAIKGVIIFRSWDDLTEEEIENETANRVVAVNDIVEIGFDDVDGTFLHASAGDVGEIVGFGDEAPTFLVDWGNTIAEVFREEIRLCVPFPASSPDAPEP